MREAQISLQDYRQELSAVRDSLAKVVQQKDAAAREHQQQLAAAAEERERLQERFATSERRLLNDVDRAREETKGAAKAGADAEQRHAAQRAELERLNRTLGAQLHQLELDNAALSERLAANERRAGDYQALLAAAAQKNAKPVARKRQPKATNS